MTPVTDTQYINEPALEAKYEMRSSVVVGDTKGMYARPYAVAAVTSAAPSSGGKSTTIKPSTPVLQRFHCLYNLCSYSHL